MTHLNSLRRRWTRALSAVLALLVITLSGAGAASPAHADPRGPCDGACPKVKVLYDTSAFSTPYLTARTKIALKAGTYSVSCEAKGSPAGRTNQPWWSHLTTGRWVHNGDLKGGLGGKLGIRYCAAPPNDAPPAAPVATIQDSAVAWALSKVGTRQCTGEQSAWVRDNGFSSCNTAWCGIFVRQAYRAAGVELVPIAYTEDIYRYARQGINRMSAVPLAQIQKGDLVLMYTRPLANRTVTHVGIATGPVVNGSVPTVEGNISSKVVTQSRSITAPSGYAGHPLVVMGVRIT